MLLFVLELAIFLKSSSFKSKYAASVTFTEEYHKIFESIVNEPPESINLRLKLFLNTFGVIYLLILDLFEYPLKFFSKFGFEIIVLVH